MWAVFLAAIAGRAAAQTRHRAVPPQRLGKREAFGSATVERWFQDFLRCELAESRGAPCPRVLGIDEHFFCRRRGYATTFCDLRGHKIFDVVLGRSEAALESYLDKLPGKDRVRVVCMDLSSTYRALVKKHFPQARIVADRFHVIRLIGHHFLACWRELDPTGAKHRGLLSLMRRHRHNLKPEQRIKLAAYFEKFPESSDASPVRPPRPTAGYRRWLELLFSPIGNSNLAGSG